MNRLIKRVRHLAGLGLCVLALAGCDGGAADSAAELSLVADKPAQGERPISYNRDIRPILSDKCFACHGPDSASREAELRLDVAEDGNNFMGAMSVMKPGDPAASELVSRIHSTKAKLVMPPPAFKVTLSGEEKSLLNKWIEQGAKYEPHWSFVPLPDRVALPEVKNAGWVRDPLDRFVLAKLEQAGLSPNKEASRSRWLRRVTLDLTGLPPTPAEIEAFIADEQANAYEKVVDRLLASSRYGEHMAGQWIDLARYADSYGYQSDYLSPTWPWRDWAIRAFNDNLPYDRFLTEQLAGDLLPNATRDQKLASAFNRLHRMTNEGGSISEEWLNEYVSDRVITAGTAFMGLTLECARCHDHKYDPITQRDFYQFYAFFNSIDEFGMYMFQRDGFVPTPTVLLPTPEQDKQWDALKTKVADAERELIRVTQERSGQPMQDWLSSVTRADASPIAMPTPDAHYPLDVIGEGNTLANTIAADNPGKTHRDNTLVEGKVGMALKFAGDSSAVFEKALNGMRPEKPFTASFWIKVPKRYDSALIFHNSSGTDAGFNGSWFTIEQGRLQLVMARFWPGNALAVQTTQELPVDRWTQVTVTYDGTISATGMAIYLDGEIASQVLRDKLTKDPAQGGEKLIFDERMRTSTIPGSAIDELTLYKRALTAVEAKHLFDGQALSTAVEKQDAAALTDYYLAVVDEAYPAALANVSSERRALLDFQTKLFEVSVMEDLPEPTPAYVLARGAYDSPKTAENRVERNTPDSLPPMPRDAPRNRLGLSQWLTDPSHPLTSRVAVNRLWMQFFGNGLVGTPDDFGLQGSLPTHPELLDYLARQYIASGWDTKAMLRRIVLSAAYRQDSAASAQQRELDPGNELLSRGPARRLSGEMMRDTALAVSGLMNGEIGGPPVAPYQPPKLWNESNSMSPAYRQSVGKDLYRRSLYTVWKRTAPMPNMLAFDAPTREVCTAKRSSTNTPLQAMVLLNDVQFVEACRALAEQTLKAMQDDKDRLDQLFIGLTGRSPDETERSLLLGLLDRQLTYYSTAPDDAKKLRSQGEAKPDGSLEDAQVAAWTMVAQAVLNYDATVWRR